MKERVFEGKRKTFFHYFRAERDYSVDKGSRTNWRMNMKSFHYTAFLPDASTKRSSRGANVSVALYGAFETILKVNCICPDII